MYRGRQSYSGSSSNSGGGAGSGGSGGGVGGGGSGGGNNGYSNRATNGINNYPNGGNNKQFSAQNHPHQNMNLANNAKNDLPPRFKKMMMTQQRSQGSTEEVSLRPSANSMVNKPKPSGVLPKVGNGSHSGPLGPLGPLVDAALPMGSPVTGTNQKVANTLQKDVSNSKTGVASGDKQRSMARKDKGPTKEELVKQCETIVDDLLNHHSAETSCASLKELKIPDRFWPSILACLMRRVLDKTDGERELVSLTMTQLKKEAVINVAFFLDAFKELVQQLPEIEQDVPRAKSFLAGLAARAVTDELVSLAELASPLEGGHQYPLFLLTLQQLHKSQDKAALTKLFNDSKVQLMMMLPELDRTKDRLAEILEDRGLGFLFPLLRIQSDLWKQIEADSSPTQFYKWIKENLDPVCYTVPGFISALFTVLLKYIAQEAATGVDSTAPPTINGDNSVTISGDRANQEKEKELIERYRPVLQAFLHDQLDLQVTVLHSLQNFCYGLNFPKGMLLRWFVVLYDLEIVEEEAFLRWKEDLSDDTPGKGKALFQVISFDFCCYLCCFAYNFIIECMVNLNRIIWLFIVSFYRLIIG